MSGCSQSNIILIFETLNYIEKKQNVMWLNSISLTFNNKKSYLENKLNRCNPTTPQGWASRHHWATLDGLRWAWSWSGDQWGRTRGTWGPARGSRSSAGRRGPWSCWRQPGSRSWRWWRRCAPRLWQFPAPACLLCQAVATGRRPPASPPSRQWCAAAPPSLSASRMPLFWSWHHSCSWSYWHNAVFHQGEAQTPETRAQTFLYDQHNIVSKSH